MADKNETVPEFRERVNGNLLFSNFDINKATRTKPVLDEQGKDVLDKLSAIEQTQREIKSEIERRPLKDGMDDKPTYTLEQYKKDRNNVRLFQMSNANMHRMRNLYNVKF